MTLILNSVAKNLQNNGNVEKSQKEQGMDKYVFKQTFFPGYFSKRLDQMHKMFEI